ncbi:serine/threonine-protein phosphatase 2A activator-like protein [Cinnamomum micranthum f. kanehirae]|uniref:Serine/threonine-protein phosphatase 2A activator n=1 Tax=Cinnamomum micranthum f. kanehirae TaxID=337451 RepID=A0A3S4PMI0_9MAGN|nr:serine/threonine-protein phosphatase 2A activator-like protein [Cinnamomum micranthum f. kanehirae]
MADRSPDSSSTTTTTTTTTPPPPSIPQQNEQEPSPSSYSPIPLPEFSPPPPLHRLPNPQNYSQSAILLMPVPQPDKVPVVSPPYLFQTPSKKISSPADARRFIDSPSGSNFLSFVAALSLSVRSRKISDPLPTPLSPTLSSLLSILDSLLAALSEFPPVPHSSRYGNPSFRSWHARLTDESTQSLLSDLLLRPHSLEPAAPEIFPYFADSFGNASRIDYGTGHETNFAAFLYCLARLGLIREEDYQAVVTRVFVKYLDLMRQLQTVYSLEPAGSHGVWGLDDYHFLPFIFGSAQLIDHKYMKPKSIHNEDILDNFADEYMYLSCVAFVKKVKKGVFAEHSPLLDDISGVPNWGKVNSGLLKMYRAEVLEKVPIMQHFLFGWLIRWE